MKLSKVKTILDNLLIYDHEYTKMKWKEIDETNIYQVNKTIKLDKDTISNAKKFIKCYDKYTKHEVYKYPDINNTYKIIKITLDKTNKFVYTQNIFRSYVMSSLINYLRGNNSSLKTLVKSDKDLQKVRFTLVEYVKEDKKVKNRKLKYQNKKPKENPSNKFLDICQLVAKFDSKDRREGHVIIARHKVTYEYYIAGHHKYKSQKRILQEQIDKDDIDMLLKNFEIIKFYNEDYITENSFLLKLDTLMYKYDTVKDGYNREYNIINPNDRSKKYLKELINKMWMEMNLKLIKDKKIKGLLLFKVDGDPKTVVISKRKSLHTALKSLYRDLLKSENRSVIHKILREYTLSNIQIEELEIKKGKSKEENKNSYENKYGIGSSGSYGKLRKNVKR